MRVCSYLLRNSKGFLEKNIDIHLSLSIGIEISESGKMEKIVEISAELFFFNRSHFQRV